jgi:hypothetical protein
MTQILPARFEQAFDHPGEFAKDRALVAGKRARPRVEHAQRAQHHAIEHDGLGGDRAHAARPGDEGVGGEARIERRVRDFEEIGARDQADTNGSSAAGCSSSIPTRDRTQVRAASTKVTNAISDRVARAAMRVRRSNAGSGSASSRPSICNSSSRRESCIEASELERQHTAETPRA